MEDKNIILNLKNAQHNAHARVDNDEAALGEQNCPQVVMQECAVPTQHRCIEHRSEQQQSDWDGLQVAQSEHNIGDG